MSTTVIQQFTNPFNSRAALADLASSTAAMGAKLQSQINALAAVNVSGSSAPITVAAFAPSQRINQLSNITVSHVSGLAASDIPALNYLSSSGGTVSGVSNFTNASTSLLSVSGPAYFGTTATSTFGVDGSLTLAAALGVGSGGTGATNFSQGWIYSNGGTGALAASTSPTVNYITATSTIGTSVFAGSLTVNGNTTLANATSTNLAVSGTASTSALVASNSFKLANLTGFLKAIAGAVSTALVNLASDVTGILPVGNGGTGWSNITTGAIPYGNGSSALATTTAGTAGYVLAYLNGVPTWTATTTLSTISGTLATNQGGTGTTTWQTGSVPFFNGTNLTENNAKLFWDNTNSRLGVGSSTPSTALSVNGAFSIGGTSYTQFTNPSASLGGNFSTGELMVNNNISGQNVLALFNSNNAGFSAITARGLDGSGNTHEHFAAGWSNPGTGYMSSVSPNLPSNGFSYIEASEFPDYGAAPPDLDIIQTGVMNSVNSNYVRQRFASNGDIYWYNYGSNSTVGMIWDHTNNRFGVNTTITPVAPLDVKGNACIGADSDTFRASDCNTFVATLGDGTGDVLRGIKTSVVKFDMIINGSGSTRRLDFTDTDNSSKVPLSIGLAGGNRVGIGTTTPSSNLAVGGNASIGADYNFAAPTNGLLIEGNVGIGTTSPATTLSVAGNGYFTGGLGVGFANTTAGTLSFADPALSTSTLITLAGRQFLNASSSSSVGNFFFGLDAGSSITSGTQNTGFGYQAIMTATSSGGITAFGYQAAKLAAASTGVGLGGITAFGRSAGANDNGSTGNTYVGDQAGTNLTSGTEDVFVGRQSGTAITTGGGNVAVGLSSLLSQTTGGNNTAIGNDTLKFYTNTQPSTAIGANALKNWVGGGNNTAVGNAAMMNFVTNDGSANSNVAVGDSAMIGASASAGSQVARNVAIGNTALDKLDSGGKDNTAVGNASGFNISSGQLNVFMGSNAANGITTGSKNIFLGAQAASTTQTGSNNIALGYDIALPTTNGSNQLNIGNLLFGTGINGEGTTVSTGNVGVGTSTPYSRLEVWGPDTASTSAFAVVNSASTTVFAVYDSGNSTYSGSIFQSSDQRLKTNITSLGGTASLSAIEALNPVSYVRLDQPELGTNLGFIAQQVAGVFPALVSTSSPTALTPDGTLTLNYQGLIAPIVKSIQAVASVSGGFEHNLIAWLGNAGNGIQDLFANNIYANHKLCVDKSDGTPVCITGDQLAAVLANQSGGQSSGQGSGSGSSGTQATSTPDILPVIQINGDNPATINVGATYSDLGATITGPQPDLNLGIQVSVDGGATTTPDQISIDTSTTSAHTISYFATDQSGEIGYATRSVIIEVATSTP